MYIYIYIIKPVNNYVYKYLLISGQPHEIHAATDTLPGIVLHVAEGHENTKTSVSTIPHTRLPEK